jgi:hypothetical protein
MVREKILLRNQCPKAVESRKIETAEEEDKRAAESQRLSTIRIAADDRHIFRY